MEWLSEDSMRKLLLCSSFLLLSFSDYNCREKNLWEFLNELQKLYKLFSDMLAEKI